jgi:hypothetical protein
MHLGVTPAKAVVGLSVCSPRFAKSETAGYHFNPLRGTYIV